MTAVEVGLRQSDTDWHDRRLLDAVSLGPVATGAIALLVDDMGR